MQNVPLGRTGITVSPLCFGTLPFSPLQGYGGGAEGAAETLGLAFELGVNFIDTAELYDNYQILRPALEANPGVIAASKTYAYTRAMARESVDRARWGTGRDVIDIFLLHEQESEHTLRGHLPALEALYTLKANGVIRAVGLSTHHVAGVDAAVGAKLDVVHPLLNMDGIGIADGTREQMEAAVGRARDAGLGVYTMKALGGGHLFRKARQALSYIRGKGHSVALGMRNTDEVEAAVVFFECGLLPPVRELTPRKLHIADWCEGCGKCAAACPNGALEMNGGKARLKTAGGGRSACVLCGYCGAACPRFCVKII